MDKEKASTSTSGASMASLSERAMAESSIFVNNSILKNNNEFHPQGQWRECFASRVPPLAAKASFTEGSSRGFPAIELYVK